MRGLEDYDVGRYRYWSWRAWDADLLTLGWILLRPTEGKNCSLSRAMHWSFRHGYGSVSVCYLFAARADHFRLVMAMRDPVGPLCDDKIFYEMSRVGRFVCAWTGAGLYRRRVTTLLSDPRWDSLSVGANRIRISRHTHQPYFGFGKMGGMVPYPTPRVSDVLSESGDALV